MINIYHASFHVYTGHPPGKHHLFHYVPHISTHTPPLACSGLQRILSTASQHLLHICSVCEGEYAHPQAPVSIWKHLDGRVVTPPCLRGEKKGIRAKVKVACHPYFQKRFMWHSSQERHKKSCKDAGAALTHCIVYVIALAFWASVDMPGEIIVLLHSALGRV